MNDGPSSASARMKRIRMRKKTHSDVPYGISYPMSTQLHTNIFWDIPWDIVCDIGMGYCMGYCKGYPLRYSLQNREIAEENYLTLFLDSY